MGKDIEIVIKVDKETLQDFYDSRYVSQHIKEVLRCGKQLPKGHGRLIDADVLADGFEDNYEFCEVVNATPTIIEADKEKEET